MRCPDCGQKSDVYDSRPFENTIRRRRQCKSCGHKYTTLEVIMPQVELPKKVVAFKAPPRPKVKKPDIVIVDFDDMSDDELEEAMFSGKVKFDEDEW